MHYLHKIFENNFSLAAYMSSARWLEMAGAGVLSGAMAVGSISSTAGLVHRVARTVDGGAG